MDTNNDQSRDKLSIGLSLFIALCVIGLFCAISIAIAKNIDSMSLEQQTKYLSLPSLGALDSSRMFF